MKAIEGIVDTLRDLVKYMVDQPDEVTILLTRESSKLILRLRVAPKDLGRVIGKQGKTARAFRQLLGAAGMTWGLQIILDIDETVDLDTAPSENHEGKSLP